MTVTAWRYLDSLESMTEDVNMYATLCFEYRGKLDADALAKAYRVLAIHHPVIRSFVAKNNGRYVVETRENEYPEISFLEGGENKLRELQKKGITSSANEPTDRRPTSNMLTLINQHGGYIVLRLRHSICDPTNAGALLSQLLEIYTDIVSGKEKPTTIGSLPRSPLRILEEEWGKPSSIFSCPKKDDQAAVVEGFNLPINFSSKDTGSLLTAAHQHGTTLGALLLGETALALKKCDHEIDSDTLKINTLVSLRNGLRGCINEADTTYLTGRCIIPVDVSNGKDSITLGKEFKSTLQDKVKKKDVYVAGYSMDTLGSTLNQIADIRFNSAGKLGDVRTPDGMDIVDFHILNFPLGESRTRIVKNVPTLEFIS